jgi:pyruvate kinase
MRRQRRTKIVATLGPASSEQATIERLFIAGADVFRVNMSHTTHDAMRGYVSMIRAVEQKHGRPIGILVDLQGPKLRLDTFAGGSAEIAIGASFVLDAEKKPGNAERVHMPHPEVIA